MTRAYLISTEERDTPTVADQGGSKIAKAWHTFRQWRARRATVGLLDSLDDRTLRDIGVGRSEVTSLVYGHPRDRTRCYEETWRP
jgi:uncharacterized protein YjiS (DUF1127 family)